MAVSGYLGIGQMGDQGTRRSWFSTQFLLVKLLTFSSLARGDIVAISSANHKHHGWTNRVWEHNPFPPTFCIATVFPYM